jgi:hypothetical protein
MYSKISMEKIGKEEIYIPEASVADPDPVGSGPGRLGPDPDPGLNK